MGSPFVTQAKAPTSIEKVFAQQLLDKGSDPFGAKKLTPEQEAQKKRAEAGLYAANRLGEFGVQGAGGYADAYGSIAQGLGAIADVALPGTPVEDAVRRARAFVREDLVGAPETAVGVAGNVAGSLAGTARAFMAPAKIVAGLSRTATPGTAVQKALQFAANPIGKAGTTQAGRINRLGQLASGAVISAPINVAMGLSPENAATGFRELGRAAEGQEGALASGARALGAAAEPFAGSKAGRVGFELLSDIVPSALFTGVGGAASQASRAAGYMKAQRLAREGDVPGAIAAVKDYQAAQKLSGVDDISKSTKPMDMPTIPKKPTQGRIDREEFSSRIGRALEAGDDAEVTRLLKRQDEVLSEFAPETPADVPLRPAFSGQTSVLNRPFAPSLVTKAVRKEAPSVAGAEWAARQRELGERGVPEVRSNVVEYGQASQPMQRATAVDKEFQKKVADWYDNAESNPNDKEVQTAYRAFAEETAKQYEYLTNKGMTFEFVDNPSSYQNSGEMMKDIAENKHLFVFKTGDDFDHPLLSAEENDQFRAVHDYFGHAAYGHQFGELGEENAFRVHAATFSPEARRAMATETRGQNSWVNTRPENAAAPGTVYADQKVVLLPKQFMDKYPAEKPLGALANRAVTLANMGGKEAGAVAAGAAIGAAGDEENRLRGAGVGALVGLGAARGGAIGLSTRRVDDAVEAPFKAFSAGLRAIGEAAQERGDAGYWLGVLSKGTRKAELDDTRIAEWLAQQKGTVTRGEVSNALRERLPVLGSSDRGYDVSGGSAQADYQRVSSERDAASQRLQAMIADPNTSTEDIEVAQELFFELEDRTVAEFDRFNQARERAATRFGTYSIPGDRTNYSELVTTAEDGAWGGDESYRNEGHWPNVKNPIAHTRIDERVVNGERVLVVNESQSDAHQAGRTLGYKTLESEKAYNDAQAARSKLFDDMDDILVKVRDTERELVESHPDVVEATELLARERLKQNQNNPAFADWERVNYLDSNVQQAYVRARQDAAKDPRVIALKDQHEQLSRQEYQNWTVKRGTIPDFPFKKTPQWTELNLKRVLEEAVKRGVSRVVVPLGRQAADMFSLRTSADRLDWKPDSGGETGALVVYRNNRQVDQLAMTSSELASQVGRDVADRLLVDGRVEGEGLDVGAQGMTGYYDNIVPKTIKDYAKKLGVKIDLEKVGQDTEAANIIENLKALKQQYQVELGKNIDERVAVRDDTESGKIETVDGLARLKALNSRRDDLIAGINFVDESILKKQQDSRFTDNISFRITPELKGAVEAGQPLYAVGAAGASVAGSDEENDYVTPLLVGALAATAGRGSKTMLAKAALGGIGYGLSRSEDERLRGHGNALMGLAAYSLVHGKVKQGVKAAGAAVAEELAKSPVGRKVLDEISLDIRVDPRVKETVDVAMREMAKYRATGRELAAEAKKRGGVFDRTVSDLVEKETVEAGALSPEDMEIAIALAQKVADNSLGLKKVEARLMSADTYAKRGTAYLPRRYAKYEAKDVNDVVVQHKGKTFRISGEKIRNDALTREERDALGEIREASYRIADYFGRGSKDIATAHLFESLSEIPGVIHPEYVSAVREAAIAADLSRVARTPTAAYRGSPTAARDALRAADAAKARAKGLSEQFKRQGQEYVTLPDTPQLGVLRGAVVRKDAAAYLNDLPDFRSTNRKYNQLMHIWKSAHTVFNIPATHLTNMASNVFMGILGGLPIQEQVVAIPRALKDIQEYGPTTRFLTEAGVIERALPTYGEEPIKGLARDETVLRSMMKTTRPETREALEAQGLKGMGWMEEKVRKVGGKIERAYSMGDTMFRVALFDKLSKQGMTNEDALKEVMRVFPGYDTRSPILQKLKHVSPFVMYPAKYLPAALDLIAEHPWRWVLASASWAAIDQASRRQTGAVREEDLPPNKRFGKLGYLKPGLIQAEALGLKSKEAGKRLMFDMARFTPFTALTGSTAPGTTISAVSDKVPALFQPSGPLMDIVARLGYNVDPFSGKPFIKKSDDAMDKLKKFTVGTTEAGRFSPGLAASLLLPSSLSYHLPNLAKDIYYGNAEAAKMSAAGLVGGRPVAVKRGQQASLENYKLQEQIREVNAELKGDLRAARDMVVRRNLIKKAMEKRQRLVKESRQSRQP
jgi:hypothetical protein